MSRVKLWIGILAVMVLALGPAAVQASLVNFNETHTFTMSVERDNLGTYLPVTSGNITTAVSGSAYFNPIDTNGVSSGPSNFPTASVTVNPLAGTWLKSSLATTSYSGVTGGVLGGGISHTFTGWGPDPSTYLNGYISQNNTYTPSFPPGSPTATQLFHVVYTADNSGTFKVSFSDTYSLFFNVDQSLGSTHPFSYMKAYSQIGVNVLAGGNFFNSGTILLDYTAGAPGSSSAIANYSTNPSSTWNYGPNTYTLAPGATITMDVYLTDYYNAQTIAEFPPVPLPSTLLLLGFGLVALAGLGRRYRYKKS